MKSYLWTALFFLAIATALPAPLDTAKIDQITGLKGKLSEKEGAYKVTFPRDDVKVDPIASNYRLIPIALPGANGAVALDYFAYDSANGKVWVPASNLSM
jgi:hypothetical protein